MKTKSKPSLYLFLEGMPRRLWRVYDGSGVGGFLVATHDWVPKPIAFVRGTGPEALRLAKRIRANPSLAPLGRDMRHCMFERLPKEIRDRPMVPVDALGRLRKRKGEEMFGEWAYLRTRTSGGRLYYFARAAKGVHLFQAA